MAGVGFYTNVSRYGNTVYYRGITPAGKREEAKIDFKPTLYIRTKEETDWKSLYGDPVKPKKFDKISAAKEYIERYDGTHGVDVFGMERFEYQYITETFVDEIEYDINMMSVWSIDIETTVSETGSFPNVETADQDILLISMKKKGENRVVTFGYKNFVQPDDVDLFGCKVDYRQFSNEENMLKGFVKFWQENYPDLLLGWNSSAFDVPYVVNRVNRILGEDWMKKLSPWGRVKEKTIESRGKEIQIYELVGITELDYMDLYKKFSFTSQESYKLGDICLNEIGVTKLEHEGSFRSFYANNWNTFVAYNIRDTQLVDLLDNKREFVSLVVGVAYLTRSNFGDVLGMVKTWDNFIYSYLYRMKIAIPKHTGNTGDKFEGAWVKEPINGMMEWICSFDAASLYPSVIKQWNLSPETKTSEYYFRMGVDDCLNKTPKFYEVIKNASEKGLCVAANGTTYTRDKIGVFPQLMEICLGGRSTAKKEMIRLKQEYEKTHDVSLKPKISALNSKQNALKTLANSIFGAAGNAGFRYYDRDMAEAITLCGQWCNRFVMNNVNGKLNKILGTDEDYVLTMDTDSGYLNLKPLVIKTLGDESRLATLSEEDVTKLILKMIPKMQEWIDSATSKIYDECNGVQRAISYKHECVASKGFFVKKKQYVLRVPYSEGVWYNPPDVKVMGLSMVKTSTPKAIREWLKTSIPKILDGGEKITQDYIDKCRSDFDQLSIEDISFPRGISDIDKWVDSDGHMISGIPIHVRASVVYNKATEAKRDLHPKISNKDKIRFIYLKMPNPVHQNVIAYPAGDKFPRDLEIEKYVDWDTQFEKTFLDSMKGMLNSLNWKAEKISSLEDFFA